MKEEQPMQLCRTAWNRADETLVTYEKSKLWNSGEDVLEVESSEKALDTTQLKTSARAKTSTKQKLDEENRQQKMS